MAAYALNPSGFAVALTRNLSEAHRQALRLYRNALKSCIDIKRLYQVPFSVQDMRRKIRFDFLRHGKVSDVDVIDMLVLKGFNLLEEARENFTFRAHVWRYFDEIPLKVTMHETPAERLEREIFTEMLNPNPRVGIGKPAILE